MPEEGEEKGDVSNGFARGFGGCFGCATAVVLVVVVVAIISIVLLINQPPNRTPTGTGTSNAAEGIKPQKGDMVVDSPKWRYSKDYDKMRRQTTYYACIDSENKLYFEFPYSGGSTGTLCLRDSPTYGYDVILQISSGQFSCNYDGCSVHVKFDDGKVLTFSASEAANGDTDTIFLHGYPKMQSLLSKSKKMIVEADFYQAAAEQMTFDVHGFQKGHK